MTSFDAKPLFTTATLGERLREVRQEARVSVEAAAQATGVSVHHLEALEAGRYEALPGDVYTRAFLRRYARYLKLNEDRVLESYEAERSVVGTEERRLPPPHRLPSGMTVTILARRTILVLIIAGIVGYLGWEVGKILAPPTLTIESPATSGLTKEQTLEVRGQTDPEAAVAINGQAVFVNEQGRFTEVVILTPGRNTIIVTAAKKRGQRSTESREMIFESGGPPTDDERATPPSG